MKKKSGVGEDEEDEVDEVDEVEDVGEEVGGSAAPDALHKVSGRVSCYFCEYFCVRTPPPPKALRLFLGVLLFLRADSRLPDVLIRESWAVVSYGRFHIEFGKFAIFGRSWADRTRRSADGFLREPYV